jgi:hypothetical protein
VDARAAPRAGDRIVEVVASATTVYDRDATAEPTEDLVALLFRIVTRGVTRTAPTRSSATSTPVPPG